MKKYKNLIILMFLIIISGNYSIYMGMERDWDMRNYHIYSPWAFLNDRITYDIMPAGIQSYFNPILDVPHFLMIKYLNNYPILITFLMGIGFALFLFFVYKIAELVFKKYHNILIPVFCTLTASLTYIIRRFVGYLSQDLFINALGLLAVFMTLKSLNSKKSIQYLSIAGFAIGIATGLKLSASVFAVPLVVTTLFFIKSFDKPLKSFLTLVICAASGFLLINGFWMVKLYIAYGNPLMPYFNHIFHSPVINADNVYSVDFYMKNFTKNIYFAFPFFTNWGYWTKLLYFVFCINILTIPFFNREKFEKEYMINTKYMDFLILFCLFAYIYWVNTLGVLRYIMFLAGLSTIIGLSFLLKFIFVCTQGIENWQVFQTNANLIKYSRAILFLISILLVFILLSPQLNQKGTKQTNRIPIYEQPKALYIQDIKLPDNSVAVTVSGTAIIAPFQNPTTRYIHLNGKNFVQKQIELFTSEQITKIQKILKQNKNKLYLISDCNVETYNKAQPAEIRNLIQKIQKKREEHWKLLDKLNINRQDKNLKIKPKYSWTMLYQEYVIIHELDKYGIDTSKITCQKIRNNLNRKFFICKLELKQ